MGAGERVELDPGVDETHMKCRLYNRVLFFFFCFDCLFFVSRLGVSRSRRSVREGDPGPKFKDPYQD